MTCKNCLHYEMCKICNSFDECGDPVRYDMCVRGECEFFKDKSRFAELPCKAGDTAYCFAPCFDEMHHPKLKVVEAEILEVRTTATVLGLDFDVDKIGKTVFLTREEAEKALAERGEK